VEMPVAEPEEPAPTPAWLDNWRLWIYVSLALVVIGYGPTLVQMFGSISLLSPGFKVW
jgi:cytochrome c oxidase subunit I